MTGIFVHQKVRFTNLIVSLLCLCHPVVASDLYQADSHFQQASYELAREAYIDAANVGSAHAFYQLGVMHYRGLGVPQDSIKALVWFNLAAEQKFNDAPSIVADLLELVPTDNQADVDQLLLTFREHYGVQPLAEKYYPVINSAALPHKIYFAEEGQDEQHASLSYEYIDTVDFDRLQEVQDEAEREGDGRRFAASMLFPRGRMVPVWMRPYSAVVDFDVGADGSARNFQTSHEIGYTKSALSNLSINGGPSPQFAEKNISFLNRAYLGVAGYTRAKIRSESYFQFYVAFERKARKLRNNPDAEHQFNLALLLMSFNWLSQNDNEIEQILTGLAESGFPLAQYEYGTKLYREQRDIPLAVHWLSEASKYGVAKAQYRLARILLDSPWVERDEKKALIWLKKAAKNGHEVAGLKAAELLLLASDKALHDFESAKTYLSQAAESQSDNPEYEYLLAMQNYLVTPRNLPSAVEHIREAISLADRFNWDSNEWQSLLANWTSNGSVTIVEPRAYFGATHNFTLCIN
ncbi:tetratricopeptide repeat protein [Paraglaciecola hydrolytica]|uniref:Sel1 repeat family protein n=1 Tax=Paraglaciecola hydrolytica TaxID=1799789 RepID=A0A148KMQ2_9ALTE|nr:SEL1-like repeat protein [Paraglaciecola hydrolytica]KXI27561.1 hypothetical protein AX660_01000 [Paraglaciecola hydrolytica]